MTETTVIVQQVVRLVERQPRHVRTVTLPD